MSKLIIGIALLYIPIIFSNIYILIIGYTLGIYLITEWLQDNINNY